MVPAARESSDQEAAPEAPKSSEPLVELIEVHKRFGGVAALSGITFEVLAGEIHALVGENGAGKSTLIKILNGVHSPDRGAIRVRGEARVLNSVHEAQALGLALVPQELELFPDLPVYENLYVGRDRPRTRLGRIDTQAMRATARGVFQVLGHPVDIKRAVRYVSIADQQMVTIARALLNQAQVLVLDEPTAALSEREVVRLFQVLKDLRRRGVGMVYISHRMDEIEELADRVTVIRDGRHVVTCRGGEITRSEIIQAMVGRPLTQLYSRAASTRGSVKLEVDSLGRRGQFADVSFKVHAGEVVGLAGLVGAGRTELAQTLFGLSRPDTGSVAIDGSVQQVRNPREAQRLGIGLVPEERRAQALLLPVSINRNISLASMPELTRFGFVNRRRELELSSHMFEELGVKGAGQRDAVVNLSGGNQQKVVLAKALARRPKVLILDEPTRGVDVGAKQDIYRLIDQLAAGGSAILLISSELDELLALADRILVMRGGVMVDEFTHESATREALITAAASEDGQGAPALAGAAVPGSPTSGGPQ